MKRTEIYYPDGRILVRNWEDGTRPAYQWIHRAVEGYIETVSRFMGDSGPYGHVQAYCNEEGRLQNLRGNVIGMKAINWPEPSCGWETFDPDRIDAPMGPVFISSDMSPEEQRIALKEMASWSPVVGPIIILRGWTEEEAEYGNETELNPDELGVPNLEIVR